MQPSNSQPHIATAALGVALQLAASHLAAAWIAVQLAPTTGTIMSVIIAVVVGMLLTATLQRTLWQSFDALDRLSRGLSVPALRSPWHGPLSGLVARIDALSGRDRE